jgi:hypothetical protein
MPRFNSLGVEMLGRWQPDLVFERLKFLITNVYEVIHPLQPEMGPNW